MQADVLRNDLKNISVIFLISVVALGFLIANPGFYSHDELQKLDHVVRYGFDHYVSSYVRFYQGNSFGTPVRPLAFFIQGVLAFWMKDYAPVVHLWAVLSNVAVAGIGYVLLRQLNISSRIAFWTALIFCLNPVAVMTTGWSAALMDRLYFFFALCALVFAVRFVRPKGSFAWIFLVFCSSVAGMSSKETFVVSPLLMGVLCLKNISLIKERRFWVALGVWVLPILVFVLFRLPALFASFNNPAVGSYNAVLENIPGNIIIYFSYPFLVFVGEAHTSFLAGNQWLLFGISVHVFLMVALGKNFGAKFSLVYLAGYSMFLIPVIMIESKGAHYLYASSAFLVLAVVLLMAQLGQKQFFSALIGILAALMLCFHSVIAQHYIYKAGVCFNRINVSMSAGFEALGRPRELLLEAASQSPDFMLRRFITGREQVDNDFPIKFRLLESGTSSDMNQARLVMNSQCVLVPKF